MSERRERSRATTAFAVVTGGGTSGHVLPALAIADGLVANGHRTDEIVYIGARRGIETRLVPPTGYPHHFLDVIGLQRRLDPNNVLFPVKLARAVVAARRILKRARPAVVISVGGYASFPATLAARLRHIPVVVVSYDRIPGLASRVSARFATACAVAFEGSKLPRARYTGAPVRRELVVMDRAAARAGARRDLGVPDDRFLVAVFGGSLGSKVLNDAVTSMVEQFADRADLAVRHVVGERFVDDVRAAAGSAARGAGQRAIMYDVIGYEDRMATVYAAADLLVTRAGASTIAELATVGAPAVIIPWAASANDHQTDNARILGDVGAARVVLERDLSGRALGSIVDELAGDPDALRSMAASAWRAGEAHRSGRLTTLIEEVAER